MTSLPYEEECFFVAPIGRDGSETRRRSDGVLDFVVTPAAEELGLQAIRADRVAKPGQITLQVVEHVLRAKAVVADLTGSNANVFYELAIRHTAKLPVVLICEEDEVDRLPFDIQQMRVIPLDHHDLASAAAARTAIVRQLEEALQGAVDSPISTVLNLQALEQGTSVEKTLADIVTRLDALSRTTSSLQRTVERTTEAWTLSNRLDAWQFAQSIVEELAEDGIKASAHALADGSVRVAVSRGGETTWMMLDNTMSQDRRVEVAERFKRYMRNRGEDESADGEWDGLAAPAG